MLSSRLNRHTVVVVDCVDNLVGIGKLSAPTSFWVSYT
jgi:hypothetical protein